MSSPFRTPPVQARAVTTERTYTHRSYNEREVVVDVDEDLQTGHFSEPSTPLSTINGSMDQSEFPEVLGNEGNLALLKPEVLEGPQISSKVIASSMEYEAPFEIPASKQPFAEAVINTDDSEVDALSTISSDAEAEAELEQYIAPSAAEVDGERDAERDLKGESEGDAERDVETVQHIASSSSAQVEAEGDVADGDEEAEKNMKSSSADEELIEGEGEEEGEGEGEKGDNGLQHTAPSSSAATAEGDGQEEGDVVEHTTSFPSAAEEGEHAERKVEGEQDEICEGVHFEASESELSSAAAGSEAEGEAVTSEQIASSAPIAAEGVAEGDAEPETVGGTEGGADEDRDAEEYISLSITVAEAEWYAEGRVDGEGVQFISSSSVAEAEWYAEAKESQCLVSPITEGEDSVDGEGEGEVHGEVEGQAERNEVNHATSPTAIGGDAPLVQPDILPVLDIITLPAIEDVPVPALTEVLPVSLYSINDVVDVESRVWPGMNKPGGRARILKVHTVYPSGGKRSPYEGVCTAEINSINFLYI